jgi:hypothetical protein
MKDTKRMSDKTTAQEPTLDTHTIDRLFLELSQFSRATTGRELKLIRGIGEARQAAMELCWQIEKSGASEELTKCSVMASALQSKLNDLLP